MRLHGPGHRAECRRRLRQQFASANTSYNDDNHGATGYHFDNVDNDDNGAGKYVHLDDNDQYRCA